MTAPGTPSASARAAQVGPALKTAYPLLPAGSAFDELLAALDGATIGGDKDNSSTPREPKRPRRRWFGRA
jgi:hypothetical protein